MASLQDPAQVELTFGVVPQQSISKLAEMWTPVLQYLSAKTGYAIHFRTAKDRAAFEQRLVAQEYDLAYMDPHHYIVFHRSSDYRVFAKEKDKKLQGIVVVRKDSPYRDLLQLQGQTIAFPGPAAFAATSLPRFYLQKAGVTITPRYVAFHDSVYRSVAKGIYPAGGGVMRTFNALDPEIRGQLRVLWVSQGYTPHAIAAHKRVAGAVVARVQKAMMDMHQDANGLALLKAIDFNGITNAEDSEYADIRKLGLAGEPTHK
jgi:phosphonate transport system substrate-binding protein